MTKKEYRKLLNQQDAERNHKHRRYGQRKRLYGDYLWYQDRERFEFDYQEHLKKGDL